MQTSKKLTCQSPRPVTYSCSLSNRNLIRKKCSSSQTENNFGPLNNTDTNVTHFNEETNKLYSTALDFINNCHDYLNKKLTDKYGECGDIKAEDSVKFKLPEIPNYASIYPVLVGNTNPCKIIDHEKNRMENVHDHTEERRRYINPYNSTTIEFVPDIKNLADYKASDHNPKEKHKILHRIRCVKNNTLYPGKNMEGETKHASGYRYSPRSDDSINTVKQMFIYPQANMACKEDKVIEHQMGDMEKTQENSVTVSGTEAGQKFYIQHLETDEIIKIETDCRELFPIIKCPECTKNIKLEKTDLGEVEKKMFEDTMTKRVVEEIAQYLCDPDYKNSIKLIKPTKLVQSNFSIVNIQPQINLLDYAQKKLEKRSNVDPETKPQRKMDTHTHRFTSVLNLPTNTKVISNMKPSTPKRVNNMFRRISQENFKCFGTKIEESKHTLNTYNATESDSDSIILDDDEFEQLNQGLPIDYPEARVTIADRQKMNTLVGRNSRKITSLKTKWKGHDKDQRKNAKCNWTIYRKRRYSAGNNRHFGRGKESKSKRRQKQAISRKTSVGPASSFKPKTQFKFQFNVSFHRKVFH